MQDTGSMASLREDDIFFERLNEGVELITMVFCKFRRITLNTVFIAQPFKDCDLAVNIILI